MFDEFAVCPERFALAGEVDYVISRALEELPDFQRETVVLRYVRELSYNEIADHMGIELGTVMSRLHRAKHKLRQLLTPYCEADVVLASASHKDKSPPRQKQDRKAAKGAERAQKAVVVNKSRVTTVAELGSLVTAEQCEAAKLIIAELPEDLRQMLLVYSIGSVLPALAEEARREFATALRDFVVAKEEVERAQKNLERIRALRKKFAKNSS